MTPLQQCAFDRIETLSREIYDILPRDCYGPCSDPSVPMRVSNIKEMQKKLSEQQDLIYALRVENETAYDSLGDPL